MDSSVRVKEGDYSDYGAGDEVEDERTDSLNSIIAVLGWNLSHLEAE